MKKINSILHDVFPPIIFKIWRKIHHKPAPIIVPLPKRERKGDKIVVIANGPSLNKTIELYLNELQQTECIMVNFSASTPLFELIKPAVYVMEDPGYIHPREYDIKPIKTLIEDLVSKTQWPMTIVLPQSFRLWWANEVLQENPNITIMFTYDGWHHYEGEELYKALDNNHIATPGQTVTTKAVWLGIYWGYPEVYLVGADTSFIKDTFVDQQTNQLFTKDTHFYSNEDVYTKEAMLFNKEHCRPFHLTMVELLHAVCTMFDEYTLLRKYADWKNIKVYNASEFSMIDCFERRKIK